MIDTVYIGIGSPHGEDRAGWEMVESLQKILRKTPGNAFIYCTRHPAEWVSQLPECKRLVICDAMISGAPRGTLRVLRIEDLPAYQQNLFKSTHGMSLLESLELAKNLGVLPDEVEIRVVEIDPAVDGNTAL